MLPLDDASRDAILAALRAGNTVAAIKTYRGATGAGLVRAKDDVEALARDTGIALRGARVTNLMPLVGSRGTGRVVLRVPSR